ncbi:FAD-dependent monooxygenase [Actinoallomurus sp. NPDC052274]|uniref:FAD-dependent monooxygenase n=1 Tax=Actinoallomurus sp. NPDC052274 TaxID=3155420 RepID=UPI00341685CC
MDTEVLIVGAGPVGLTAAIELTRRGVACRVVDELAVPRDSSRGCTVYQRTLEVFDGIGLAVDDYVDEGVQLRNRVYHLFGEAIGTVDMAEPDSPRPYPLLISQAVTERRLEGRLNDLGVQVERGTSATDPVRKDDAVEVTLSRADGGRTVIRTSWLIAAQGAASGVREALGVEWEEQRRFGLRVLQADARIRLPLPVEQGEAHMFFGANGHAGFVPLPDGRHRVFVVRRAEAAARGGDPDLEEIGAEMREVCGVGDIGLSDGRFAWRVRLQNRIASRFRVGRCLLVGDSARVFAPVYAQGMNTGVQDAVNLGWKLAAVIRGGAPETLVDSYEAERRPVALELLERTERSLDFGVQPAPEREALLRAVTVNRRKRTQLRFGYHDSPLTRELLGDADGPRAGERAPDAPIGTSSLFREWRDDDRWTLLMVPDGPAGESLANGFRDPGGWTRDRDPAASAAASALRTVLRGHETRLMVLSDPAPALRDVYAPSGSRQGRLYLVRPDGYIGFRGALQDAEPAASYLRTVLG